MSDPHEDDEEPCVCADKVPADGYYHCPICDADWWPEGNEEEDDDQ